MVRLANTNPCGLVEIIAQSPPFRMMHFGGSLRAARHLAAFEFAQKRLGLLIVDNSLRPPLPGLARNALTRQRCPDFLAWLLNLFWERARPRCLGLFRLRFPVHSSFQTMRPIKARITAALNTNPKTCCPRVQGQRTASRSQFNQTGGGSGCINQLARNRACA